MSYSVNQSVFKREQVRIVTTHLDAPNSFFSVVYCFRRVLWCVFFVCFSEVTFALCLHAAAANNVSKSPHGKAYIRKAT